MICINFVALKRPISAVATDKLKVTVSLTCGRKMICCTHTHTHLTALCLGLPRWAGTRKVKPIWILLKQETVSGSGISWPIAYASAYRARQTTMPTPHRPPLSILQAGCPSCCPTNSGKALNAHVNQSCSSILSTLCLQQWTDGLDIH